jgi:hypothetical protein
VAPITDNMPRVPVPTWSGEPSGDHEHTPPEVPVTSTNTEYEIVDLYAVMQQNKDTSNGMSEVPFVHEVHLDRPKGEIVQVHAVFDDSAMICAMSTGVFSQVRHRLAGWQQSRRLLHMANGVLIPSQATWMGTFEIKGVKAHGTFKVFDSGGGWSFLFSKPMLQVFKAEHNYKQDTIQVRDSKQSATLMNQIANPYYAK